MHDFGSTTGTPITMAPGTGTAGGCHDPTVWTLLALPRYAKILGLDPLHFMQGYSALRPSNACNDIWHQYDWQDNDKVSRYQLSQTIAQAERDLADQLGYWPAPVWIEDERLRYPRPQRTDIYRTNGLNIRGRWNSIRLKWGYVIMGGERAETLLAHAHGADIDTDGDGFSETAVFTVTIPTGTELCEVHAYIKEYAAGDSNTRTDPASSGADPPWEVYIEGREETAGVATIYIRKWHMFKPQLKEELDPEAIDADTATNYVNDLIFYRVWTDPQDQVEFQWASDVSCNVDYAAAYTTQAGAFSIRDNRSSIVVPEPGTWDATVEMFTKDTCWAEPRDPDYVRVWYLAGYRPERAYCCDWLDGWWAETIAMLATARLTLPLCTCSAIRNKVYRWQEDLSEVGAQKSFNIDPTILTNPFGTRRGEVEAWKRLVKARGRVKGQAILA